MARKSPRKTLLDLVDDWVPTIRDAFLFAMQDVTDAVILNQVIAAIQLGDPEKAFKALGLNQAAMRPVIAAIENAYEAGGVAVGRTFPKSLVTTDGVSVVFRFDIRDVRAEKWLREMGAKMVQTEFEHVRTSIRNLMADGVTAGNNPRRTALDIVGRIDFKTGKRSGGVIGLTSNQERWVANVRLDLENLDNRYFTRELRNKRNDAIVREAIKDGKPLSQETINKLTGNYKKNALRYRGEVIGRDQALKALRQSNREAYLQAVDMGAAKSENVKRFWDATGDKKTRPEHNEMETITRVEPIGMDEPYVFPDGESAMMPGDDSLGAAPEKLIQCRCIEQYVIDWAADVD